jgi:glutathione peroxidase
MNAAGYALASLNFLDWWLLAIVLGIADVFVLRRWLVLAAIAAGIMGFVLMLFPQIVWPWQVGGFIIITVAGVVIRLLRSAKSGTAEHVTAAVAEEPSMSSFHDFKVKTIDGQDKSLRDFTGHTVLVVNVASECGLTPQYAGLEKLYREFKDREFAVLGLPCNQFGAQEPGNEAQIRQFCSANYAVSFPLASKIEVNGAGAHPLYQWLKSETGGADIQWNFEKFLIGKNGRIIKRYSPKTTPEDPQLRGDVQAAL